MQTGMSASSQQRTFCPLFDHLVRARLQCGRHGEAEGFGGLQIDVELDLRCLLHRQVRGFRAIQDTPDVDASEPIRSVISEP